MKEINFYEYDYFTDSDNKVDFNSTDIIGDINWEIFDHLEFLIGIKKIL